MILHKSNNINKYVLNNPAANIVIMTDMIGFDPQMSHKSTFQAAGTN